MIGVKKQVLWKSCGYSPFLGSATVSDETDKATNEDPDMGTQFFMYIEPDIVVNDHPNMGDTGIDVSLLMMAALAAGTAYLGVSAYANKAEKHMAEIR